MKAGPKSWFALPDPYYEAWEAEQRSKEAKQRGPDHGKLADVGAAPYVLVLHKNESLDMPKAVGVMSMAGIGPDVALRLLKTVEEHGLGIVVQGKQDDMLLMRGMFAEYGMKATVQGATVSAQ